MIKTTSASRRPPWLLRNVKYQSDSRNWRPGNLTVGCWYCLWGPWLLCLRVYWDITIISWIFYTYKSHDLMRQRTTRLRCDDYSAIANSLIRADSTFVPHWLGANLESALINVAGSVSMVTGKGPKSIAFKRRVTDGILDSKQWDLQWIMHENINYFKLIVTNDAKTRYRYGSKLIW